MAKLKMHIYIPSRSRIGFVETTNWIPAQWRDRTTLVVPKNQKHIYAEYYSDWRVVSTELSGIHNVRQAICDAEEGIALMLDDDMTFAVRKTPEDWKLRKCNGRDMDLMFNKIEHLAQNHWAIGISARQGNNNELSFIKPVARMNNAYAINCPMLREQGVRFDRLQVMEDFDVTLNMLTRGLPNAVLYEYCWNQRGSGLTGGCSDYRTAVVQTEAAYKLKNLYPKYVTVVEKKSKSVWKDMQTRTDVRIQWKKAYNENI